MNNLGRVGKQAYRKPALKGLRYCAMHIKLGRCYIELDFTEIISKVIPKRLLFATPPHLPGWDVSPSLANTATPAPLPPSLPSPHYILSLGIKTCWLPFLLEVVS